jgi:hypothetical protein
MEICRDCKFFLNGDCHRYPPIVITVNGFPVSVFPHVSRDDTCGEHSPKPAPKKVDKPGGK